MPPNQPPGYGPQGYGPQGYGPQGYGQPGPSPYAPNPGFSPNPFGQPPPTGGYEFGHAENEVIARAGSNARGLGILSYVSAGFGLLGGNLVSAAINFVVGYQFHQGGTALKRVVETPGNDIAHLMAALDKLSTAFMIRLVLVVIAAVLFVVIGLFVGAAAFTAFAEASRM